MEENNQQPQSPAPEQSRVIDQVTPATNTQEVAQGTAEQHQENEKLQPPKVMAKSNTATIAVVIGVIAIIILIAIALLAYKKTG